MEWQDIGHFASLSDHCPGCQGRGKFGNQSHFNVFLAVCQALIKCIQVVDMVGFRRVPAPGASSLGPPMQLFQITFCSTGLHRLPYFLVPLHKICVSAGKSQASVDT